MRFISGKLFVLLYQKENNMIFLRMESAIYKPSSLISGLALVLKDTEEAINPLHKPVNRINIGFSSNFIIYLWTHHDTSKNRGAAEKN